MELAINVKINRITEVFIILCGILLIAIINTDLSHGPYVARQY